MIILFVGRRMEFEKRRKAHYNEFEAVRLARKLIEEEDDDDEDDNNVETVEPRNSSTDAAEQIDVDIASNKEL